MVGAPLSILQLVLHCKYWKRSVTEEPNKVELQKRDLEKVDMEKGLGNGDVGMGNMEKNVTKP